MNKSTRDILNSIFLEGMYCTISFENCFFSCFLEGVVEKLDVCIHVKSEKGTLMSIYKTIDYKTLLRFFDSHLWYLITDLFELELEDDIEERRSMLYKELENAFIHAAKEIALQHYLDCTLIQGVYK